MTSTYDYNSTSSLILSGSATQPNAYGSTLLSDQGHSILNQLTTSLMNPEIPNVTHIVRQMLSLAQRLPSSQYSIFLNSLNNFLQTHIGSQNPVNRMKGLKAMEILIDIKYDDPRKITKFCMILKNFLSSQVSDSGSLKEGAKLLGKLARESAKSTSKTKTAEWVEFESKRAMEWLEDHRSKLEIRRYAAVLVLKELAENAPTLFYPHVGNFIIHMWHGIKDSYENVRIASVHALRAVLALIAERQSTSRVEWYHDIWDKTEYGLQKGKVEQIHGCLLVLGELLRNTGAFMQERFDRACSIVLKFSDHKDKQYVRKTVLKLLPILCSYYKTSFQETYLKKCIDIITKEIKSKETTGAAYIALGKLVKSCDKKMLLPKLPQIMGIVQDAILSAKKSRSHQIVPEVLTCLAYLGEGVGDEISEQILTLLDPMFQYGLSKSLTDALTSLVETNPSLRQPIQQHLLDSISIILAKIPYHSVNYAHNQSVNNENEETIIHALETLGAFNFKSHDLIDFVRDTVISYMDNDNFKLKKAAAQTCCKILAAHSVNDCSEYAHFQIGDTVIRLLTVAITDSEYSVRQAVLSSFTCQFDNYLSISENVKMLFIALNDEHFEIRELAIKIIGRLSTKNPACVYPPLRKTLLQLLTELQFSEDVRNKEESAKMLGCLISSAPILVKPYVANILRVLMSRIHDPSSSVSACVLETTGKLMIVGGADMIRYIGEVLPFVVETLSDQSSSTKRTIAVRTLGQIIESTGYVVKPYQEFPNLLSTLLNILKSEEEWEARREVMRVLGIIGAIDPHKYKILHEKANYQNLVINGDLLEIPDDLSPSSDEYYPTVAFSALMKILRDPSLSSNHTQVIQAILYIFTSLGMKCVPFLKQIMGPFFDLIRAGESKNRMLLFQKLSSLVSIVRHHIRNYLDDIFKLIKEFWDSDFKIQIISLEESICLALSEEFKPYLSDVIPHLLDAFQTDHSTEREVTIKGLHALTIFGKYLQDYLYLVVPAVVRLFEDAEAPITVKCQAIRTIGSLSRSLNLIEFSSRIIHPFARVLKSGNQDLIKYSMDTLTMLAFQFGHDFIIFTPMISKIMMLHKIQHQPYQDLEQKLRKNQPPPTTIQWDDGNDDEDEPIDSISSDLTRMHVDVDNLREGWKAYQRSTKDDWNEWIRGFSMALLKESPSPALRACHSLAQTYFPLARELFNAGFVSCWQQLDEKTQQEVVRSLELAFSSPELPAEVLQTLLNLAEFMEHDEKPLPIDVSTLGLLAQRCQCYAKALHYKEVEFLNKPDQLIEDLMFINNQLGQHEAVAGILKFSQKQFDIEMKDAWFEKLQLWEKALKVYEKHWESKDISSIEGKMRCLKELGRWEELYTFCQDIWKNIPGNSIKESIAPIATAAAWNIQDWNSMEVYSEYLQNTDIFRYFYKSILAIHDNNFELGLDLIEKTRIQLSAELSALVGESYIRAYDNIILIQQLSEMEEIIQYKQINDPSNRERMKRMWYNRLKECTSNVEHWLQILLVRRLVLSPDEDRELSIKFSSLCRKSNKLQFSEKILRSMLPQNIDPSVNPYLLLSPDCKVHPTVTYNYFKHMWKTNQRLEAFNLLNEFVKLSNINSSLSAKCYLRLGLWQKKLYKQYNSDEQIRQTLHYLKSATIFDPNWYKAWHYWALMNYEMVHLLQKGNDEPGNLGYSGLSADIDTFILNAINAFFKSINLLPDYNKKLQDILRLLTLWFKNGNMSGLETELANGFNTVRIETWLGVIPQIIARVDTPMENVRILIHNLLEKIGQFHPQALIYPLTVCSKSQTQTRKIAAQKLLNQMRIHSNELVDQANMVSNELVNGAILWSELWYDGLEDASRMCFSQKNYDGMNAILEDLHQLTKDPKTLSEIAFTQQFGGELMQARELAKKYRLTKDETYLSQAWDGYYLVFRRITRYLHVTSKLELQFVSPKLLKARNLKLAVPGTYNPLQNSSSLLRSMKSNDGHSESSIVDELITIASFNPVWKVITSKQRPRQITIRGSNGHDYEFLLKGHEDLRQDERAMQLFGLVNTLLETDLLTSKKDLGIKQYAVIPLSSNAGLCGWVPNCDTLHTLVKKYRESRSIVLNLEHRLMLQMTTNYENLTLMQKIEVFEHALENTTGQDLYKILWLKSKSSEVWLDRRTNYTRSLAVMSMVGYILGLGDRHPSNIMLEKHSGKIVHIDFGDCFEVAQNRDKFPEKVPFRLTRMLVNAMEVCGIEGSFRATCEDVMRVLRENKESLMAILEAFVYDPLINWRLIEKKVETTNSQKQMDRGLDIKIPQEIMPRPDEIPHRSVIERQRKREFKDSEIDQGDKPATEHLNQKALEVIKRISDKLNGNDFKNEEKSSIPEQVSRLIQQATSHSNLSQLYMGWSAIW